LINNDGNATLSVHNRHNYFQNDYYKLKIDRQVVEKTIASSDIFLNDTNMTYKKITKGMMDEANIKIRINQNNSTKTINLIDADWIPEINDFMRLFHLIDSAYVTHQVDMTKDTLIISDRREKFIRYSMIQDSILIGMTPPPSEILKEKI